MTNVNKLKHVHAKRAKNILKYFWITIQPEK